MDSAAWALVSAVFINILIFIGLFCAFSFYRKYRSKHLNMTYHDRPVKNPPYTESEHSIIDLLKICYKTNLNEIAGLVGEEGQIFLYFHKYMIIFTIGMTIISIGVLLPVYETSDGDVDNEVSKTGIARSLH
mmetsp:Transcript_19949/g.3255  ORF Transcript_19949/g.3255 Transcript_19949/m.3255 type:complete len:132 (+) Transcript_19949:16-411(+)